MSIKSGIKNLTNAFATKGTALNSILRIITFGLATGILGLGAGNLIGLDAITSASFGALMAVLGLIAALFFIFAGKGGIPQEDFDRAINSAIDNVQSKNGNK